MKKFREYLDFEIENEVWNEYELEDGTHIKGRAILVNVAFEIKGKEIGYESECKKIFGAIPPKELYRTPPNKEYSMSELKSSIVADDLKIIKSKEEWNEYKLKDGTILNTKLVMIQVGRTNKYDEKGKPIYLFKDDILTKAKLSKKVEAKIKKLAQESTKVEK